MIRRLQRRISSVLVVALLCTVSAGALCALPCAAQPSTQGTTSTPAVDHCASPAKSPSDRAALNSADGCREHDKAVPAVETSSRRLDKLSRSVAATNAQSTQLVVAQLDLRTAPLPPERHLTAIATPLRI